MFEPKCGSGSVPVVLAQSDDSFAQGGPIVALVRGKQRQRHGIVFAGLNGAAADVQLKQSYHTSRVTHYTTYVTLRRVTCSAMTSGGRMFFLESIRCNTNLKNSHNRVPVRAASNCVRRHTSGSCSTRRRASFGWPSQWNLHIKLPHHSPCPECD